MMGSCSSNPAARVCLMFCNQHMQTCLAGTLQAIDLCRLLEPSKANAAFCALSINVRSM